MANYNTHGWIFTAATRTTYSIQMDLLSDNPCRVTTSRQIPTIKMQLSNLLLLAVAVATSLVADSIPSGQGKIQLQNGTHVYGCLDTNAMFTIDTSQCVTLTADGSTGVISWANGFDTVYLGIPDAYPQPLLFFNSASQAINWVSLWRSRWRAD